ncbi:hypothetical protein NC651_030964 [Populus alba x Populus x berolinensis]|nr:hypothetical protein NC651_030964 [Populus alba x Populus x berolinensis]
MLLVKNSDLFKTNLQAPASSFASGCRLNAAANPPPARTSSTGFAAAIPSAVTLLEEGGKEMRKQTRAWRSCKHAGRNITTCPGKENVKRECWDPKES